MAAGLNLKFEIVRINYSDDDVVGGAVTTGTVVYTNVFGRLQGTQPDQILLSQGLETDRMFTIMLQRGDLDVRERDYIRVTHPYGHPYYQVDLRVLGVTYSNFVDPRKYLMLSVSRSVRAHSIQ